MEKEFKTYLLDQNLSKNTITSYLYALRQFEEKYDKLTKQNLRDYKVYLIENYKPQTVNLRIRAINCYLESIRKEQWKLPSVKIQQKPFLQNVISEADYLYFKNCLKRDNEMYWYFVVRFLAATGAVSVNWFRSNVNMSGSDIWICIPKGESCGGFIFRPPCRRKP